MFFYLFFVIIRRKEDIWLVKTNKSEQERKDDGNGKFIRKI